MFYLAYYQGKNHQDVNHFDTLTKIANHVKSCKWADNFAIFADHWDTHKIDGVVRPDGSILWESSDSKTEPSCKFLNNLS